MSAIHVDRSYRTLLGTAFYDRVSEVEVLERLMASHRLLVVYGPRNVGKSELVRYFLRTRYGSGATVIVDARRLRSRSLEERMGAISFVAETRREVARRIKEALTEALSSHLGIIDLVIRVEEAVREALARLKPVLVFVDEFHEFPGYTRAGYEEALEDLRSLAGLLSKSGMRAKVLVTVSEGFVATSKALALLEGYSAGWLLVEHLEQEHFRALYREYREKNTCHPSFIEIYALVGGTPGMLPNLCPLSTSELIEQRIATWIELAERALSETHHRLEAIGIKTEPRELIKKALQVLEKPIKPLLDHQLSFIADALVERNIAYPKRARHGIYYLPQYPIYKTILIEAVEHGVSSLLDLDPAAVYEKALSMAQN